MYKVPILNLPKFKEKKQISYAIAEKQQGKYKFKVDLTGKKGYNKK